MLRPNWDEKRGPDPLRQYDQKYDVIVGHARVRVTGASRTEAVEEARRRLCVEMPRMWDVIQSLGEDRFCVPRNSAVSEGSGLRVDSARVAHSLDVGASLRVGTSLRVGM